VRNAEISFEQYKVSNMIGIRPSFDKGVYHSPRFLTPTVAPNDQAKIKKLQNAQIGITRLYAMDGRSGSLLRQNYQYFRRNCFRTIFRNSGEGGSQVFQSNNLTMYLHCYDCRLEHHDFLKGKVDEGEVGKLELGHGLWKFSWAPSMIRKFAAKLRVLLPQRVVWNLERYSSKHRGVIVTVEDDFF